MRVFRLGARLLLASLIVGATPLGATTASADEGGRYVFDQRCDEIQGTCWSTVAEGGHVYLAMESANHGGEYQVCVTPPRGRGTCRPVRLRHRRPGAHGYVGFVGRIDFEKSFETAGGGQYRVRWKSYPAGLPLGPALAFKLRADGSPEVAGA